MAGNGADNYQPRFLAPPVVTALREEARGSSPSGSVAMERSLSEDIREAREDLKEAAEQTLNVIVDLHLDGRIKWVSPSWIAVIGTPVEDVEGKMIKDIILDNKTAFEDAITSMKQDDSRSQIVRFAVRTGPASVFRQDSSPGSVLGDGGDGDVGEAQMLQEPTPEGDENILNLEAQGIMVFDRASGGESHTMWVLRPSAEPREITIDLPPLLVDALGVGAEMLANYLTDLAEVGANDPANHPPPMPVLCRICERQITPWWFEKHSDLCLLEHRAEMEVQMAQDNLNEHRHAIVKVLDALEVRSGRSSSVDANPLMGPYAEYKGLPIGPSLSTSSSGFVSGSSSSSSCTPPRSRDPSASGLGHTRARPSFAVRRPLTRIVELILDLCDTALEISTPALKEARTEEGENIRTLSPQSESRVSQVLQWQSPSSHTLDQEQGLAALAADTERAARAKVDAVRRHRRIVEYGERIRIEFTVLVEECISVAMSKAGRIAAGQLSDSSDSFTDNDADLPEYAVEPSSETSSQDPSVPAAVSSDTYSATAGPLRTPSEQSLVPGSERHASSAAISTRSSSPLECPTPRSHRSARGLLNHSQPSKRSSMLVESDTGDSDSSILSPAITGARRTESPSSERALSRAASTRDKKRQSLILSGVAPSPRRESPGRNQPPHSPLRLSKPRLSTGESIPSPIASPLLTSSDLVVHGIPQHHPLHHHHHHQHHRRQSSATSPELGKPPISPHLTSVSHPPPRAMAPSIKDFEIIKPISKGAFGSVYLSKKKSTGEYFAIKVLKKADMVAKNQVTNVKAERAIMMWQGESDFVAKLYWTFSSKDYLYLVMEYLNGGDCASLVKVLSGLPEDWAKKYIAEVVLGVEHLHSRGIVHRDLKPDNLLIDQKGHLKLTDFGLSRMGLVGRQKRILKGPNESAPDLLKQGPFTRETSLASSRSTSFDFPTQSPNTTPLFAPDVGQSNQPSYFNLNREPSLSRESSRRASGYRSDSGGSDTLSAMFRTFSLHEGGETPFPVSFAQQQSVLTEEETPSEGSDSPYLFPLQPLMNQPPPSISGHHGTPPQQSMMPPAMALFDPDDHDRCFVGTPDYLAPETIKGVGQDEMSDWWSLGCILFEFLYGYPPFNADTPDEVFENILQRRINWPDEADELASPEAKDLMNKLMTLNPEDRLGSNISEKFSNGAAEVRNHPWFSDINWCTLLEDKAQFVPAPENPEDTEYFDPRGATLQSFTEELEDQPRLVPGSDYPDRPHDALYKVRSQVNSLKRGLMPLHIPPHVRESRSRRLSEPVLADDFGNFNFKNLPVLEKANKDVIQKMRQEAMQAQQRSIPGSTPVSSSGPSLEGSPLLPMPLKRTLSQNKRPASPSSLSQTNSSPSRPSQPSSPLLVQFSTGLNYERRKTSGSSSTFSQQSSGPLLPGTLFEPPRLPSNLKQGPSAASSPIKLPKAPAPSPEKAISLQRQSSAPTSRSRSQTLGSQEGELPPRDQFVPGHHNRRSQLFDISPSSSDNEDPRAKALLKVQRRRQSSRRLSQVSATEGPFFRPLDVLICEDHPVSKLVMERLFEKLRCRTITAVNGSEAMRYALSEVQFDIIMTEFKLPQINGADVARMVRETKSANTHTPIIAVTGYLKDLPETHNFDWLIEKPPTLSKLTEALNKFCQWKPPSEDQTLSQPRPIQPSVLRNTYAHLEDSPSSGSSGFVPMPPSSYRGSSREDSVGSSYWGDIEPVKTEEAPIIISRQATDEWNNLPGGGLGISEDLPLLPRPTTMDSKLLASAPDFSQSTSAPAAIHMAGFRTPRKQRSVEGIRAKRESMEKRHYLGAESGDDEDEELGDTQSRVKSPHGARKTVRSGSKLGTEMMRTNSRGSVVSGTEEILKETEKELEACTAAGVAISAPIAIVREDGSDDTGDRLNIGEDVLETLPEDTELEESRTPQPRPASSLESQTAEASTQLGHKLEPEQGAKRPPMAPLFDLVTTRSHSPPASQSVSQLSSESHAETEKGNLKPPTAFPDICTTPAKHHTGKDLPEFETGGDSEVTPKPASSTSNIAGAVLDVDGDSEPTPRASERDRSRTRDRVMEWIRR